MHMRVRTRVRTYRIQISEEKDPFPSSSPFSLARVLSLAIFTPIT
jgi:hypothetical protein